MGKIFANHIFIKGINIPNVQRTSKLTNNNKKKKEMGKILPFQLAI